MSHKIHPKLKRVITVIKNRYYYFLTLMVITQKLNINTNH